MKSEEIEKICERLKEETDGIKDVAVIENDDGLLLVEVSAYNAPGENPSMAEANFTFSLEGELAAEYDVENYGDGSGEGCHIATYRLLPTKNLKK